MSGMKSQRLVELSVSAEVSEFFRAELEAFVDASRRLRPAAWARVDRLQQTCLREAPANAAGRDRSERVIAEMLFG